MTYSQNHTSIVRRGNHFIRLPDARWVLIDGPWFRSLNRFNHDYINMLYIAPPELVVIENVLDPGAYFVDEQILVWEKVLLHPGTPTMSGHQAWRMREVFGRRFFYGWRAKCDGLPCFLNHPGWIDDEWESSSLMQRGY